jgi:hypothetical protein
MFKGFVMLIADLDISKLHGLAVLMILPPTSRRNYIDGLQLNAFRNAFIWFWTRLMARLEAISTLHPLLSINCEQQEKNRKKNINK